MITRIKLILQARAVRGSFVLVAVGAAIYAVATNRDEILESMRLLPAFSVMLAFAFGVLYLGLTLFVWKSVLAALGSRLSMRSAVNVFFVSQLGKYVPGGLWNMVAAGELGASRRIPRHRSVAAMAVALLVSAVTGLAVACLAIGLSPRETSGQLRWAIGGLPLFAAVLWPPVLNRVLAWALRITRRPELETQLGYRGTGVAVAWCTAAWAAAGVHLWILTTPLGLPRSATNLALVTGGYALAWVVGFLVIVVPAGLGARETVLLVILSTQMPRHGVLTAVLMSRVLLTLADIVLGIAGLSLARREARMPGTDGRSRERP